MSSALVISGCRCVASVGASLGYHYPNNIAAAGPVVLFSALDSSYATGLFSFNPGTGSAAEVSVSGAFRYGLNPANFTPAGSVILFSGTDAAGHNSLFSFDPATGSAAEVSVSGAYGSGLYPSNFMAAGTKVLFTGTDVSGNAGLFSYDAATGSAAEVSVGGAAGSLTPYDFTAVGAQVLFVGNAVTYGPGLFSYDPASNTAVQVGGNFGSNPTAFTVVGSRVLFTTSDSSAGNVVLHSYDSVSRSVSTVGTDAGYGPNSYPYGFTVVGSHVLFSGVDTAGHFSLFSYDSTANTATEIVPASGSPLGLNPMDLSSNGSVATFYAKDATGTFGFWQTDGTAAGTVEVLGPGQAGTDFSTAFAGPGFGNLPPSIAITSGATAGNMAMQVITGTLTAGTGASAAGQVVTLLDNGAALSTASPVVTDAQGRFSATVTLPYQGSNSLVARSQDSAGTAAQSAAVVDTLDSVAPTLTLSASAAAVPGTNPALVPFGTEAVTGRLVSGGAASVAGQVVTLSVGGIALATTAPVVTDANGAFTATLTLPDPGPVNLVASSTDSYGNAGASAPVTVASHINAQLFGVVTNNVNTPAGLVYGLYEAILGHAPDPIGFEGAVYAINTGTSLADVAQPLLSSADYTVHYGAAAGRSPTDFITTLYENGAGREPDAAGLQGWTAQLAGGTSQAQVAAAIGVSPETLGRVAPAFLAPGGVYVPSEIDASIARVFYGVLNRAPDSGGLQYLEGVISRGGALIDVVADALASPEYHAAYGTPSNAQFVNALYQNTVGRPADPGQGWTAMLDAGASRASVALQIVESPEARADMAPNIEGGFRVA